ncbi:hypothetical protein [Falsiroseomonas sp.]|uniref:hypothetical protein n=1 Tax=Falsiroseomonas sp. TaxID=2870721 RepID=UPI003F701373
MVDEAAAAAIARIWTDAGFRKRLVEAPGAALPDIGIAIPGDATARVVGSKGAPGDQDDPSLIQVVLERDGGYAYFFIPSPRSPCAQQAAYGMILARAVDDPALGRRVLQDAERALSGLAAQCRAQAEGPAA